MKQYLRTGSAGALVLGALMMFAAPVQAQDLKELNIMVPNNNTTTLYPVIVARELDLPSLPRRHPLFSRL